MAITVEYAAVQDSKRHAIYALRVKRKNLSLGEIDELSQRMQDHLARRGEMTADVVVVESGNKETLRLHGLPYSVSRIRAAMFNAQMRWMTLELR